jgi:carboxylesterase
MHNKPSPAVGPHIIPSALPRLLEGPRRTAVLLLHGWTGYPGQSYYLGERLNAAGYTVSIPRLPGHGTDGEDLMASGSADWIRKAEEACRELREHRTRIVAAGISMGALLALHLAAHVEIEGLVLAAPAVTIKHKSAYLAPLFQRIIREIPAVSEGESRDEDEKYIREEYWSKRRLKSVADLLRVQRIVRRELKRVSAPMIILETEQDELVTPRAGRLIARSCSSADISMRMFKESRHQMLNGCEREAVADTILAWVAERYA